MAEPELVKALDRVYIFAYIDPTDRRVCYIAMTDNVKQRLATNLRFAHHVSARYRTPVHTWLFNLSQAGLRPVVRILEVIEGTNGWPAAERRWIVWGRREGLSLLNVQAGGGGQ